MRCVHVEACVNSPSCVRNTQPEGQAFSKLVHIYLYVYARVYM